MIKIEINPSLILNFIDDNIIVSSRQNNPHLNERMRAMGIPNLTKLEEVYIQKLVDMTTKFNASALVWQEVFDNGVLLPSDTIVHIWTGDHQAKLQQVSCQVLSCLLLLIYSLIKIMYIYIAINF